MYILLKIILIWCVLGALFGMISWLYHRSLVSDFYDEMAERMERDDLYVRVNRQSQNGLDNLQD